MKTFLLLIAFPVAAAAQPHAHGTYLTAPYGQGGTWNLYQTNSVASTWSEAQAKSEALVDPMGGTGKKGHLVTIGSAAENMFVFHRVLGPVVWVGLTDNEKWGGKEAGSNRKGQWRWVTGEPVTYTAWRSPEPNEVNAGGEDGVGLESSGRWADWASGSGAEEPIRHASMVEWDTQSDKPISGVVRIGPVLPATWPVDFFASKGPARGKGPWLAMSYIGLNTSGLALMADQLKVVMRQGQQIYRVPHLNYRLNFTEICAGGWVEITGRPDFPFSRDNSGVVHMARIRLEKPGTWSFNLHCDDYAAVRIRGQKWKSVTGLGGADPLDPSVIYYEGESGDGCMVGAIDLPAGESIIEVILGNCHSDGMIQLLAAPGEVAMDGGTDQWRFPGHKAGEDLSWPGM
ncbi:MAG: hypothetical protein EOP85_16095, partial [Verrucomicrobiaceae bacterium]